MRNETLTTVGPYRVILMDSISLIGPFDAGSIIVCGSHGGLISGAFAAKHPPALVFFNDAGVGKREAGIAALEMLEKMGVSAAAIAHSSARIGDALDAWESGIVSHCNGVVRDLGLRPCQAVQEATRIRSETPGVHSTAADEPNRDNEPGRRPRGDEAGS